MEFAEVFLKLTAPSGPVIGDCQDEAHKGEIVLFDWSWGLELEDRPSDALADTERTATPKSIGITKPLDRASTTMMTLLNKGEVCKEAVLVLKQSTEKGLLLKLVLKDVQINGYKLKVDCSELEVELSEDWTLGYKEVQVQYSSPLRRGGASTFSLINQKRTQSPPAQLESFNKKTSAPSTSSLDEDDVTRLIDEHLKKLKIHPSQKK